LRVRRHGGDVGVDAVAVRREGAPVARGEASGEAVELRGRVPVATDDLVHQEVIGAEHLCEPAGGGAAEDVHFEQAVFRLRVAIRVRGALVGTASVLEDVGDTPPIAQDGDGFGRLRAGDRDEAEERDQRAAVAEHRSVYGAVAGAVNGPRASRRHVGGRGSCRRV
jgi:hypothetical protein